MKAAVRAAALVARHGRGFAASAETAVAEADPFLRFATPIPAPYNFTAALSSVPDTKASMSLAKRSVVPSVARCGAYLAVLPLTTPCPQALSALDLLSGEVRLLLSRRSPGCRAAFA